MSDVSLLGSYGGADGAPIVESGSNANGEYIKYADGTMICTQTKSVTLDVNLTIGSLYRSDSYPNTPMPQTFTAIHYANVSVESSSNNICWLANFNSGLTSFNQWRGWYIMDATSITGTSYTVRYIAIGRWK